MSNKRTAAHDLSAVLSTAQTAYGKYTRQPDPSASSISDYDVFVLVSFCNALARFLKENEKYRIATTTPGITVFYLKQYAQLSFIRDNYLHTITEEMKEYPEKMKRTLDAFMAKGPTPQPAHKLLEEISTDYLAIDQQFHSEHFAAIEEADDNLAAALGV